MLEESLPAKSVLFDVAFNVAVTHMQLEFQTLLHIDNTRVGTAFSVDFAIEQL